MRALITEFRAASNAVTTHLHARYGISVVVTSIQPPLKCDLDGSRILVADHNTHEEWLFSVAHLFGHTVQWNVSAELGRLGMTMPVEPTRDQIDTLEACKREPFRYSQQAVHEAGVSGLDQWLADFSPATWPSCGTSTRRENAAPFGTSGYRASRGSNHLRFPRSRRLDGASGSRPSSCEACENP